MGLAVSIGMLDDLRRNDLEGYAFYKAEFARLSEFLASEGFPGFEEPEGLDVVLPKYTGSFPYSFLHYLRRAFAHVRAGAVDVPPCSPGEDPAADDLIDDELTLHMDSHLVCHSDAEGYYVPIDFPDVLYPDDALGIRGGMVGSSQQLVRELLRVAPGIGIAIRGGAATAGELARLAAEGDDSRPLFRERLVWLSLYVLGTASVRHESVLDFH